MSDNKKYPRTYHFPWSPGTTSDDRIAKESDLIRLFCQPATEEQIDQLFEDDIIITEKLDGENCGMPKGGVYARSHAVYTESPWSLEVRRLHSILRHDLAEDETLFGENMEGIHSIEYDKLTSYFYLFGVRRSNKMLSWTEVEEYAYLLNIPTVPVLFKGKVKNIHELKALTEKLLNEGSKLGNKIEGLVVRTERGFLESDFSQHVFKWVRKNHVQTDQHWTRNWKKAKLKI
jgi:hypothetical protein